MARLSLKLKNFAKTGIWTGIGITAAEGVLSGMEIHMDRGSDDLSKRLDALGRGFGDFLPDVGGSNQLGDFINLFAGGKDEAGQLENILSDIRDRHLSITAATAKEAAQLARTLDLTKEQRKEINKLLHIGRERTPLGEVGRKAVSDFAQALAGGKKDVSSSVSTLLSSLDGLPPIAQKKAARFALNWAQGLKETGVLSRREFRVIKSIIETNVGDIGNVSATGPRKLLRKMGFTFDEMVEAVRAPTSRMAHIVAAALEAFGEGGAASKIRSRVEAEAQQRSGHGMSAKQIRLGAATGFLPGKGLRDSIPIMAAPGEAILNRHQQAPVESALRQTFGFGLDSLFRKERRPHFMAQGGFAGPQHFAKGGLVTGDTDFLPAMMRALQKLAKAAGTPIFVQDGRRTLAEQAQRVKKHGLFSPSNPTGAAAPSPNAPHVRGVAADITPGRSAFGALAGKFGLGFPLGSEPWHIQLTGAKGGAGGGAVTVKVPTLPRITVTGEGAGADLARAATSKVRAAAQRFLEKKAPTASASASDGSGETLPRGADDAKGSGIALFRAISKEKGWNFADWWALDAGESSHGTRLVNPDSTARLRGQFLDMNWGKYGPGSDPRNHPSMAQQIISMADYIEQRYGNPTRALKAWLSRSPHWYAQGGFVPGFSAGGSVTAIEGHKNQRSAIRKRQYLRIRDRLFHNWREVYGDDGGPPDWDGGIGAGNYSAAKAENLTGSTRVRDDLRWGGLHPNFWKIFDKGEGWDRPYRMARGGFTRRLKKPALAGTPNRIRRRRKRDDHDFSLPKPAPSSRFSPGLPGMAEHVPSVHRAERHNRRTARRDRKARQHKKKSGGFGWKNPLHGAADFGGLMLDRLAHNKELWSGDERTQGRLSRLPAFQAAMATYTPGGGGAFSRAVGGVKAERLWKLQQIKAIRQAERGGLNREGRDSAWLGIQTIAPTGSAEKLAKLRPPAPQYEAKPPAWKIGSTGKGLVHKGKLYVWKVDDADLPFHDDILTALGPQAHKEYEGAFWINEDGHVGLLGQGFSKKTLNLIQHGIPGARMTEPAVKGPFIRIPANRDTAFARGGLVRRKKRVLVGEEGPELAKLPSGKHTLVGREGPELRELPAHTRVFSHPETKRKLKRGGIQAFAKGGIVRDEEDLEFRKAPKGLKVPHKSLGSFTDRINKFGGSLRKRLGRKGGKSKHKPGVAQVSVLDAFNKALDETIPTITEKIDNLSGLFGLTDEEFYPDERVVPRLRKEKHNIAKFGDSFVDWTAVEDQKKELDQLLGQSFQLIGTPWGQAKGIMEIAKGYAPEIEGRLTNMITRLKGEIVDIKRQIRDNLRELRKNQDKIDTLDGKIDKEQGKKKPDRDRIKRWRDDKHDLGEENKAIRKENRRLTGQSEPSGDLADIDKGALGERQLQQKDAQGKLEDFRDDRKGLVGLTGDGGDYGSTKLDIQKLFNDRAALTDERITESVLPTASELRTEKINFDDAMNELRKRFSSNFTPIQRFAKGGLVRVLVGEEGPEFADLPAGTRVHSHPATKRLAERMGAPPFARGGVIRPTGASVEPPAANEELTAALRRIESWMERQRPNVTIEQDFLTPPEDQHAVARNALHEVQEIVQ